MGNIRDILALSFLALTRLVPVAEAHVGARKSVSFRQPLLNTQFVTNPPSISDHTPGDTSPHDIAHRFIKEHISDAAFEYYIRDDSYTDQNTGISHVYIRQLVNGLEVSDGDMNLNIRDGQVLSYGSSIYTGTLNYTSLNPSWSQENYCAEIPRDTDPFVCGASLDRIRALASLHPVAAYTMHDNPIPASYFFTIAVSPDEAPSGVSMESALATREQCSDSISTGCWSVSSLPGILSPVKARLVYVQTHISGQDATQLNLAWRLEVEMEDNHYEAYVSAHDPSKIIASIDWVQDAPAPRDDGWLSELEAKVFGQSIFNTRPFLGLKTVADLLWSHVSDPAPADSTSTSAGGSYRVWKWTINDPASGNRTLQIAPYTKTASPLGWHALPAGKDRIETHPRTRPETIINHRTTVGNNVIAQANWSGRNKWISKNRPDGGSRLIFDFPYGANPWDKGWRTRNPRQYVNASVTQHFYIANMYHDLLYLYGFDEPSGNFQQHNFGKGGKDGDAVIVQAQDNKGYNNANFLTPPDGENGWCRMYIYNRSTPHRDGGLDASILIHELSHGLSKRLTGGPRDSSCLGVKEGRGMGEGWSDWIGTVVRSKRRYSDYPHAAWANNNRVGSRRYPYAKASLASFRGNPSMYDFLQRENYQEVHRIGEVWAEILWVVSNKLVDKHGFEDSLFPTSNPNFYRKIYRNGKQQLVPNRGNTLALQLVVNAMKLQPCNPTILQARDAIIAADKDLTGGSNRCSLWAGFASRGLGINAKSLMAKTKLSINGDMMPAGCR
ncbi:extracellular metalloproteinase MEP [Ceratobasidium sp. AG-Ba]|nr:extracellular metalloproteinase MEP [Ceratobasidium sp. AG-Ba]